MDRYLREVFPGENRRAIYKEVFGEQRGRLRRKIVLAEIIMANVTKPLISPEIASI